MAIHLQHPADEGHEDYRKLARASTLCWNSKPGCEKTTDEAAVTCKKCLVMLANKLKLKT